MWLLSLREYGVDMLLFAMMALILIYFALLGTGYSELFAGIVIPIFILIILYYMFEGAPQGVDEKSSELRRKLRKWGRRAVMGCVVGLLCYVAGPTKAVPSFWIVPTFSLSLTVVGLSAAGISFGGFCLYWMRISKQAEAIAISSAQSSPET
jgi:hypothetical protein